MLQCVAVCCRVLQSAMTVEVEFCNHGFDGATVCCSVLQCVAVCCSVLQCVVVCCHALQCAAAGCSI